VNLLDTNVLSHLQKQDPIGNAIAAAMAASSDQDFQITAVNAYEMLGGAFDLVRDLRKRRKSLTPGFQLFLELLAYLSLWQGRILPYDDTSDQVYRGLPPRLQQELKNDARIAAIALRHGATVWTRNVIDFQRVPGLVVYVAETGLKVP
jgi:predicted nucleic acid-binding protein